MMITLFGRYVLYELIDIFNQKNNSERLKLGKLHLGLTIFIVIITLAGFGYTMIGNANAVYIIPFRLLGVLILITSFF